MQWDFDVCLIKSAEQSELSSPSFVIVDLYYSIQSLMEKSHGRFTRFSTLLSKETADNDNRLMAHFWSERSRLPFQLILQPNSFPLVPALLWMVFELITYFLTNKTRVFPLKGVF